MNLKRLLAGVLACRIVGGALPAVVETADKAVITANAEATVPSNLTLVGKGSEGDFSCNYYSDGSLLIDGYDGKESVVTIPESINGKKVRSFLVDFYYFGITITDVYVPGSVALLGNNTTYKVDEAIEKMKSNGITLHIVGDIPDTPEPDKVPYTYKTLNDGTIEITGWDRTATEAVIPSEVNGIAVTSIGFFAFSRCTELLKITIPDSVKSIDDSAFYYCENLTSVTIPNSVTSIDSEAFRYCHSLTEVNIPDSVTEIGGEVFKDTPWLESKQAENPLVIVNGILIDGTTCTGDVVIPDNVTSICHSAFSSCSGLTSIIIPDGVTSIDNGTFHGCYNLTSVIISDSVTSIKNWAFECCSSLTEITIPNSVTSIGMAAFNECKSLTEITIPNSVTSIGTVAFSQCTEFKKINILNPNCEIADSGTTFFNGYDDAFNYTGLYFNGTIYGYEGSTAQAYAEKHGRNFVSLGEAPEKSSETGDIDGDGKIDSSDASIALSEYSLLSTGKEGNFSESQKKLADLNKDGTIDASDASLILAYYSYAATSGTDSIDVFLEKQGY